MPPTRRRSRFALPAAGGRLAHWVLALLLAVLSLNLPLAVAPPAALAEARATHADRLLGQPSFTTNVPNLGGVSAQSLDDPRAVAVDSNSGRLFVADTQNHRVLSWPSAASFTSHQAADLVVGQPNFTTNTPNTGGVSEKALNTPEGVAVDLSGNLYVADMGNNRVLVFKAPLSSGMRATFVLGQADFTSNRPNRDNPAPSSVSLSSPAGVAVDTAGNVYVADYNNNRVLGYPVPTDRGQAANKVFGQPDFTSGNVGSVSLPYPGPASLNHPWGVALDPASNLYVGDLASHRVLVFNTPFQASG